MFERVYNATFLVGMIVLSIMAMCIANGGCKSARGGSDILMPQTGNKIASAQAHVETAQAHVELVIPHTFGEDKANLNTAAQSLTMGAGDLVSAQQLLGAAEARCSAKDAELVKSRTELADERSHWVGYRSRRAAAWILGIGTLLWVGLGIAGVLIKGALGGTILNALPLSNLFQLARARRMANPGA